MKRYFFYLFVIFLFCAACTMEDDERICCGAPGRQIRIYAKQLDLENNTDLEIEVSSLSQDLKLSKKLNEHFLVDVGGEYLRKLLFTVYFFHKEISSQNQYFSYKISYRGKKIFEDRVSFRVYSGIDFFKDVKYEKQAITTFSTHNYSADMVIDLKEVIPESDKELAEE